MHVSQANIQLNSSFKRQAVFQDAQDTPRSSQEEEEECPAFPRSHPAQRPATSPPDARVRRPWVPSSTEQGQQAARPLPLQLSSCHPCPCTGGALALERSSTPVSSCACREPGIEHKTLWQSSSYKVFYTLKALNGYLLI